jgi:hypothetical protein
LPDDDDFRVFGGIDRDQALGEKFPHLRFNERLPIAGRLFAFFMFLEGLKNTEQ